VLEGEVGGTVGSDDAPVGKKLAGVVEEHHAVAQQAPPLLGMKSDRVRSLAISSIR
jgi:hypothetical protein